MTTLARAALAAAILSAAAQAGVKITTEVKRAAGPQIVTMAFSGTSVRMDTTKDGSTQPEHAFIRDGEGKRMVMISFEDKTYTELTDEQMQKMKDRMQTQQAAAMAKMKDQLAKMTPEQRAQVEAMMSGKMGAMGGGMAMPEPVEEKLVKASGSKKVAGYSCENYKVMAKDRLVANACLIPWASLKLDREQVRKSLQVLRESMHLGTRGAELHWDDERGMLGWRKSAVEGDEHGTETTLISFAQMDVPAAAFAVPPGLTKKSLPGD